MKKFNKYFILLGSIIIFILCGIYNNDNSWILRGYVDYSEYKSDKIIAYGPILNIEDSCYILRDWTSGKNYRVHNTKTIWKVNEIITMRGKKLADGSIEYLQGEIIWDRKIKMALSVFGLIGLAIIIYLDRKKLKISF